MSDQDMTPPGYKTVLIEPSRTGLALQIATIGAEGYYKNQALTQPETGRAPDSYDEL